MITFFPFNQIKRYLAKKVTTRAERWLKQRIPSSISHQLTSRNVFILPTRFGFAYLLLVLLLFFLGTNYQNNAIMLLSYLLASFFITVMMHSFFNLYSLTFTSYAKQSGFSKQSVTFPLRITATKEHYALILSFPENTNFQMNDVRVDQCSIGDVEVTLPVKFIKRGLYSLGRLKISSEYSFGLFVTWTHLDFNYQAVVFPAPQTMPVGELLAISEHGEANISQSQNQQQKGIDDFAELKPYIVGESLARIAWKQFAKGQGKLTKHYQQQQGSVLWLQLRDMPHSNIEIKLSLLSFLILEYSQTGQIFGLDLSLDNNSINRNRNRNRNTDTSDNHTISSNIIAPDTGQLHKQACLTALAHFSC